MTALLPNGKQQFLDSQGTPLVGGSVGFYTPGTLNPKTTWQDAGQTTANANPLTLDGAGEAIIYGYGQYRQIVQDSLGNTIWDQLTQDPSSFIQTFYMGTTSGSKNAQTASVSPANPTALAAGQIFYFIAGFTNDSALTLNFNSLGVKNALKPGAGAPVACTGGEVVAGGLYSVVYDGTQFQLQNFYNALQSFTGAKVVLPSGAAVQIGAAQAYEIEITGTTTITAFDSVVAGTFRFVEFDGVLTLTHNATSLILPTGANITTAAGDTCCFLSEGSGNWRCFNYQRANGQPLALPSPLSGSITAGTSVTQNPVNATGAITTAAHGLGGYPAFIEAYIECLSTDAGYAVGDRILLSNSAQAAASQGISFEADATNCSIVSGAGPFNVINKSSFALATLTNTKWKAVLVPYKINP